MNFFDAELRSDKMAARSGRGQGLRIGVRLKPGPRRCRPHVRKVTLGHPPLDLEFDAAAPDRAALDLK